MFRKKYALNDVTLLKARRDEVNEIIARSSLVCVCDECIRHRIALRFILCSLYAGYVKVCNDRLFLFAFNAHRTISGHCCQIVNELLLTFKGIHSR